MFESRSALERFAPGTPVVAAGTLRLREERGGCLAHLTASRVRLPAFLDHLAAAFGAALPAMAGSATSNGGSRLLRLTREQFWWIAADEAAPRGFAARLPAAAGSVTLLSDARVRLCIDGEAAGEFLQQLLPLDLHPGSFPVGRSAQTGLHHTGVLVERTGDDAYELFIPRTFAATIWEYLVDAALPYGARQA